MPTVTFEKPQEVSDVELASLTKTDKYLPPYQDIPEEFNLSHNAWNEIVSIWFFMGLDPSILTAKPGINKQKALRHLTCCMRSWEPKHEHKIAGVAYLMSLWFEPITQ